MTSKIFFFFFLQVKYFSISCSKENRLLQLNVKRQYNLFPNEKFEREKIHWKEQQHIPLLKIIICLIQSQQTLACFCLSLVVWGEKSDNHFLKVSLLWFVFSLTFLQQFFFLIRNQLTRDFIAVHFWFGKLDVFNIDYDLLIKFYQAHYNVLTPILVK